MNKVLMTICFLILSCSPSLAYWDDSNKPVYMYDRNGIYQGQIRQLNKNTRYETNNHGIIMRVYKKNGNVVHVYDSKGRYVSSFRK